MERGGIKSSQKKHQELVSGNNTVNYEYDEKRRKTKVKLNGNDHLSMVYDENKSSGAETINGSDLFWSTVGGVFIGASTGLAVGGLIVATGGAIYGAIHGISAIVPFVGLTALKTFAIGALAFNQFAFITAPLLGITMDGIETIPDGDKTIPQKPGEAPRHPYGQIGFQWLFPFNRNVSWYYKLINL